MVSAILVGTILLAGSPAGDEVTPSDRTSYEAARAGASRDADAHVRLALWCEAHGLKAERLRHLAIAVMVDPRHALARALLGLVEYGGRWQRPEAVREEAAAGAVLAQYRDRRARAAYNADAQWALALWCEENGLKAEAVAHLSAVVRLDPKREAAWKRLGYSRQGRRWVTEAQLAEEKTEAQRQDEADRRWRPILEKWREHLGSKNREKRAEADRALSEITDPRAVPSVWKVFATGNAARQGVAVRVLGQIDAAGASRALAMLAAFSESAEIRRRATETLKQRDVREFANVLIALVRDPVKYKVRPVGGPGTPGALFVEGKEADVERRYSPPPSPELSILPGDRIWYDDDGLPVVEQFRRFSGNVSAAQAWNLQSVDPVFFQMARSLDLKPPGPSTHFMLKAQSRTSIPIGRMQLEAQQSAAVAQQQLINDVTPLERYNQEIKPVNDRALAVLGEVSGQDLGPDRESWTRWWTDQLGYTILAQKTSEKATVIEDVPLDYQPQTLPLEQRVFEYRRISCFGGGTPVHTLSGIRPIESLAPGDRVLTQNIANGGLRYQPVLVVHRNPPSKTFRIALGDETIVSSYFHRFWKAGQGWVMARDLKVGDRVRTLGGLVPVGTIEEGRVQPVFNLDVADDADFFVGGQGALVHDNTLPDLRQPPFDAPPSLASVR